METNTNETTPGQTRSRGSYLCVYALDRRYLDSLTNQEVVDQVFGELARAYKNMPVNFGVIDSEILSDICLTSQNFFEGELEEALRKEGISDVKVTGLQGSNIDLIRMRMKKETKSNFYPVDFTHEFAPEPKNPILYKFERRKNE